MTITDNQPTQSYSSEAVQEILQLAIASQVNDNELSKQQLTEIAADLGISPDSLAIAEQQWLQGQILQQQRQEFERYRQGQFKQKLIKYLIVNSFLAAIDYLMSPSLSWSLYVMLLWGLNLSLNAWKTFQSEGPEFEQAFERWQRQYELKRSWQNFWEQVQAFFNDL